MCISYQNCNICPRNCGVDRTAGQVGYCRSSSRPTISRAAPHMWEEPIISGTRGSGTVFFSGCSLRCIYCQNYEISRAAVGRKVTDTELSDIMLRLAGRGVHNINFVTPTHFAPSVRAATAIAREKGLNIPIVYNTSSYENTETLRSLDGTVDIYLADMKYLMPKTAKALSAAEDYPRVAKMAISEMVSQCGSPEIRDCLMTRGVIVRILLLPGHVAESKLALKYLYETYGDNIFISLMSQYTPIPGVPSPLNRRVTNSEYSELCDYAVRLGVANAFIQEHSSSALSYIPKFDSSGV